MAEFYRSSGRVTGSGLGLGVAMGAAAAIVGAFIYSLAVVWIPFVYINLLLTVGFGFAIAIGVGQGARIGKTRNPLVVAAATVACALLGLYVAWGADFWFRLARAGAEDAGFTVNPLTLTAYAGALYEEGSWGLKSWTVTGIPLATVWLVEAGIVVGIAGVGAMGPVSVPFCETRDR